MLLEAQEQSFLSLTHPQPSVYDQYSSPSFFGPPGYSSYNTPPSSPYSPVTAPAKAGLKFYKGGQFTPGGGRAPAGGRYMSPSPGFSSRSSGSSSGGTFYKGGQFTAGGGRAPKGGCWK